MSSSPKKMAPAPPPKITAFKDTWEWNEEAARSYEEVIEQGGRVADAMQIARS